jgi:flavin-dependent dehydrogenase
MDRIESIQNLSDETLIRLAAEAAARQELAKQDADTYKDEIRRRFAVKHTEHTKHTKLSVPQGGTAPGIEVKLTYPRKFNEKLARELLTEKELAKITVEKLDGALARKVLAPDDYREVTLPETTRVGFKVL